MNKFLLAATLAAASFAASAETQLIIGVGSYHFDKKSHEMLNESNPAIGIKSKNIKAIYVSKNSWGKKSAYLTYSPSYEVDDYFSLSADLGVATGYKCSNSVEKDGYTLNPVNCSAIGLAGVAALSVDYRPLAGDLSVSFGIAPNVAVLSFGYSL